MIPKKVAKAGPATLEQPPDASCQPKLQRKSVHYTDDDDAPNK